MPTEVIHSIKSTGGDYSSLSAWEAAQQRDLVAVDEIAVAECYNDFGTAGDVGPVTVGGWTTDSARYPIIRAAVGSEHNGIFGSGYILKGSTAFEQALVLNAGYVRVIGIELQPISTSSFGFPVLDLSSKFCIADGIIINSQGAIVGSGFGIKFSSGDVYNVYARNCLIVGDFRKGFVSIDTAGTSKVSNCTVVGAETGVNGANTTVKNSVCINNLVAFSTALAGSDYNAASDGSTTTPPGANSLTVDIVSTDFVDAANNDYHLTSGSQLRDVGIDLSTSFTTDVDGDTRTAPWDIGFDAFVSAVGALTISAPSIVSQETVGGPALSAGASTLTAAGINSTEGLGSPGVVAGAVLVQAVALPSAESFGIGVVQPGAVDVSPNAVNSAESFGVAQIQPGPVAIQLSAIASLESLGVATVVPGIVSVQASGIGSGEAVGNAVLQTGTITLQLAAIGSAEQVGVAQIQPGPVAINPASLLSDEALGDLTLLSGSTLVTLVSIGSAEAVGAQNITPGAVDINAAGLNSAEQVGAAQVSTGAVIVLPTSISSLEQHGDALIFNGSAIISPTGVVSGEQVGAVTLIGGADVIGWLSAKIETQAALHAVMKTDPALIGRAEVNRVH